MSWLVKMKHECNRLPKKALFTAMASVILAELSAIGISGEPLFERWSHWFGDYQVEVTLIIIFMFVGSTVTLYRFREELLQPKGIDESEVKPHRCLIMPLSYPAGRDVSLENTVGGFYIKYKEAILPRGTIDEDIKALDGSLWTWQQFLRGLAKHQKRHKHSQELEAVYLIGTKGTGAKKGSYDELNKAEFLVRHYMKSVKHVFLHEKAVDPEKFNELCEALNEGIRILKNEGYQEKDIIIDVTGATKVVSIAGAAVTMDNNVKFQYVQTEPEGREHKVKVYDVIARSKPASE